MDENHLDTSLSPVIGALLIHIREFLAQRRIEAYIVGGKVRDLVMARTKADTDIAVAGDALVIGREMADYLDAHFVVLDSQNGVVRLLPKTENYEEAAGWQLDIATLEGNLLQDLGRRDFTVDAMAIGLGEFDLNAEGRFRAEVIDPFGGLGDIRKKHIRAVNAQVFQQDAIRLLRGVRLGADLGFTVEPQTEAFIERDHDLIKTAAAERIREELLRLLALNDSYETIVHMDKLGLLTTIIPELSATRDVEQPQEHTWNVFHHSARSVSALDFILRRSGWEFADPGVLAAIPWNETLAQYFETNVSPQSTRRMLTKLAALLHDIAKPQTRIVNEFGKVRFYGHPQEGAPIAAAILERLRFSNREAKFIETITRYHLRPVQMTEDWAAPTRRAVYRYFRDLGEAAIATLYFSLADHLATRGSDLEKVNWDWHVGIVTQLMAEYDNAPEPAASPAMLDGHDLQRELGLKPGRRLGELLEEVREAQAAGEITTKEEALNYVKKLMAGGENGKLG